MLETLADKFVKTAPTIVTLPMPPRVNAIRRAGRGRIFKSKRYTQWQRTAGWELAAQRPRRVAGPVSIDIAVGEPDRRRRDVDNLPNAVLDLLTQHQAITDGLAGDVGHLALGQRGPVRSDQHLNTRGAIMITPEQISPPTKCVPDAPEPDGNAPVERRPRGHFAKLETAKRALEEKGQWPPDLRPIDRYARICGKLKELGYREHEISSPTTGDRYFSSDADAGRAKWRERGIRDLHACPTCGWSFPTV